ncbi:MAG: NnrS family protein [Janthinobacterium lividum]
MPVSSSKAASPGAITIGYGVVKAAERPFYLLASSLAVLVLLVWMGSALEWTVHHRLDSRWFAHEAIFGVLAAVFVGFFYKTARDWVATDPLRSIWPVIMALVWLAGRGAMLAAPHPALAAIDCAFLFLAPLPFYRVLRRSRMLKHVVLVDLLCLLALLNFLYHAATLGLSPLTPGALVGTAALVSVILAIACARHAGADRQRAAAAVVISQRDNS